MGVGLADDAEIGIVQMHQALDGQVTDHGTVHKLDSGHVRQCIAVKVFLHQGNRREHPGNRSTGQGGAPHHQVRRGITAQQSGFLIGLHRRHADVNAAASALIGFFEGVFANIRAQTLLQGLLVHQAFAAHGADQPAPFPGLEVVVLRHQHFRYLGIGVHPENTRDNGADTGAGDHLGQQPLFPQCLDDSEMEHAQRCATAEQQGGPAKAGQSIAEELQLVVNRKVRHRVIAQIIQGFTHLADVFFDQVLGAHPGTGVQRRVPHVAQIVVQAFAQRPLEALEVVLLAILFEVAQAIVDQLVVVKVRNELFLPLGITFQKIQLQPGFHPLLIGRGAGQGFAKTGNSGVLDHLLPPGFTAQKSSSMKSSSSAKGSSVILPSLIRNSRRCRKALRTNVYWSPEIKLSAGIRSARLSTICRVRR